MRNMLFVGALVLMFVKNSKAQEDPINTINLDNVNVSSYTNILRENKKTSLTTDSVRKDFLNKNFTGDIAQTLSNIPGIQSMDIASGFAKPMIRGMAFNRIAVVENNIKQEGQQWGSDHGLEIDGFNVDRIVIHKGPVSLMYGSDGMGGVIEILKPLAPINDQINVETNFLGKSVNDGLSGSVMAALKRKNFYYKIRYTQQNFGDYKVLTDNIVYLTQKIPIYNSRLKNTAGWERNLNFYTEYKKGSYSSNYNLSNVYQKVGFFPGAHGLPDPSVVKDDGNSRNVDLPYSKVNHFKITSEQKYIIGNIIGILDIGYQNNHREEWSKFHTHYSSQDPPSIDPDKELAFNLDTYSSVLKLKKFVSDKLAYTVGSDLQYQNNNISGYSFLLPKYNRFSVGLFSIAAWQYKPNLSLIGGLRYDYGKINISSYIDKYLMAYLKEMGYGQDLIDKYKWRSYKVDRDFGNFSSSIGLVLTINSYNLLKFNIGNSFRLPSANELGSNGLHHGAFRHEQGTPILQPEKGWQADLSFIHETKKIFLSVSPFFNFFSNYIYLKPTGIWSVLPHAGQIYKYNNAKALIFGSELVFNINLLKYLSYNLSAEYIYTYNLDEFTALSFSPPASIHNTLTYKLHKWQIYIELYTIADQYRIARNETPTKGANLINSGIIIDLPVKQNFINISFSIKNILNTKYYNHLSFYKNIGVPEAGRNLQLLIKIPLTFKI